jgi:hypothetical protein
MQAVSQYSLLAADSQPLQHWRHNILHQQRLAGPEHQPDHNNATMPNNTRATQRTQRSSA